MEAFLVSTGVVAVAELGDKTQLLALILAARYARPVPIVLGILAATLANHAGAAVVGTWLTGVVDPVVLRWALGISFIAMAAWALIPDSAPDDTDGSTARFGVFLTTAIAFFLVEIGDKTQIATAALAARFDRLAAVVIGTTLGMMIANVPAVLLGDAATRRLPMTTIRRVCAGIFLGLGIYALVAA